MRELLWLPYSGAAVSALLCTLNADNGQIFIWIVLGIGLVSRGRFW